MENNPWECPRCGRINAPFNPACFCNKQEVTSLEKILSDLKEQQKFPGIPMYPEHGWLAARCSHCGVYHGSFDGRPIQCVDLQSGLSAGLEY